MEKEYFALNTTVTEGSAASLGLKEIAATDYVYRPGTAAIATPEQERGI